MNDFLVTTFVLLVSVAVVSSVHQRWHASMRQPMWLSFIAHQAAAVINILITEYYYGGGDAMNYRYWGSIVAERMRADFFGVAPLVLKLIFQVNVEPLPAPVTALAGNTGSMQGISAFLMLIFNDSLFAASAAISTAAYLSKVALLKASTDELPDVPPRYLMIACLFMPSAVFWSSTMLKEPVATIGLLTAVYGFRRLILGVDKFKAMLMLAVGCSLVLAVKGYIFPVFGGAAAIWYWVRAMRARRGDVILTTGHGLLAVGICLLVVVGTGAVQPEFAVDTLDEEVANLQIVGARVTGNSTYNLGSGSGNATAQVALAPLGLLTALYRPVIFEVSNPLMALGALEVSALTILTVMAFLRRGILGTLSELLRRPFLAFCLTFVIAFGTGVGIASTNLGSLARYRMPLIPFFAILLLTLNYGRKVAPVMAQPALGLARRPFPERERV